MSDNTCKHTILQDAMKKPSAKFKPSCCYYLLWQSSKQVVCITSLFLQGFLTLAQNGSQFFLGPGTVQTILPNVSRNLYYPELMLNWFTFNNAMNNTSIMISSMRSGTVTRCTVQARISCARCHELQKSLMWASTDWLNFSWFKSRGDWLTTKSKS